jgi:TonB family protein
MRWAIAISIVLHCLALSLMFRGSSAKQMGYPTAIIVHLASPPPARGVESPASSKAAQPAVQEKPKKVAELQKDARISDINPKKKPTRQQPKPEPQPAREEARTTETKSKGLPEGVELGSEFGSARLDESGFDSPYYLNILLSKIRNQWDNPFEGTDTVLCTIYFVISRDGRILDSAVESSSGIAAYDQSALRAVLSSKPPPLPNQFASDELGIHLEFQYLPYY